MAFKYIDYLRLTEAAKSSYYRKSDSSDNFLAVFLVAGFTVTVFATFGVAFWIANAGVELDTHDVGVPIAMTFVTGLGFFVTWLATESWPQLVRPLVIVLCVISLAAMIFVLLAEPDQNRLMFGPFALLCMASIIAAGIQLRRNASEVY